MRPCPTHAEPLYVYIRADVARGMWVRAAGPYGTFTSILQLLIVILHKVSTNVVDATCHVREQYMTSTFNGIINMR